MLFHPDVATMQKLRDVLHGVYKLWKQNRSKTYEHEKEINEKLLKCGEWVQTNTIVNCFRSPLFHILVHTQPHTTNV